MIRKKPALHLSGAQDSQRTKDQWATAAAVVIFWPAAFLVGGDKQTAAELANMKGQMVPSSRLQFRKSATFSFKVSRRRAPLERAVLSGWALTGLRMTNLD